MKRASESSATKGPKRPRATDLVDPSRPFVTPVDQNAPSSSSSISHRAVSSALSLTQVAQPTVPDVREQPPRWDHMRQQLLRLPVHLPHCLPYIVDETVSITPEEAQSAIQGVGTCTNVYNWLGRSLLTISWCVASSMPNPPFPATQSNDHYGLPVKNDRVYHQIPTIILHTNSGNLPTPPRPLAGGPLPRTFPEFDHTPNPRRSPSTLSLRRPWEPFLPASMPRRVHVIPNRDLAASNRGGIIFFPAAIQRLLGPGSVLKEVESRVLPFLRILTRLNVFGTWKDDKGPDGELLLNMADELTNLTDLQSRLKRSFSSKDRALEEVERLNHSLDSLEAIDQYALRVALDACALLGGVELPTWPSSVEFAGTWLEESKRNVAAVPASYISQCRARDLERWGIPCWLESPRRQYSRLEATKFGLPTGDRQAESNHQKRLQHCPRPNVRTVHMPVVTQAVTLSLPECPLPSPETWDAVKSKIPLLLDPDVSVPLIFQNFNREMGQLLGEGVWSGKRYEAQQHSGDSIHWMKAREGAQEILHVGVIHASLEIPSTWRNPQMLVAEKTGMERLVSFEPEGHVIPEAAVAAEAWFGVELVGYQAGQEEEAPMVASSYNALGYRFVQAPQQLKDAEGRTIPRSLYQIELLFKSRRQQQDACREIHAALPAPSGLVVSPVDLEPFGYDRLHQFHLKADPYFLNHLYSVSLSLPERERLLRLLPRYPVPPAIHSTPSDVRASKEAVYLWRLVHFSLFEYDREYLLPGYAPQTADAAYAERFAGTSSSSKASSSTANIVTTSTASTSTTTKPASPRTSLPIAELPLASLGEIVFAPDLPFSSEDVDRLRRLYLCLLTGKRRAPFHASIFPFPGSSYRNLLVHVVRLVEEISESGRFDFSYRMGPSNSSAGVWDEKLTLDAHGRVKITMDPASNPEWDATRDVERVGGYVARCVQLSGIPRHQKRRRKQAQQAGKGKQAEIIVIDSD
jgi:hypothetical protein